MKQYILIAGCNGVGKTTIFQTMESLGNMPRINVDEIVRKNGSWKSMRDVANAGKTAIKMMQNFFESGKSFNQETTLCGNLILQNIAKAKAAGYKIFLYYIGVANAEILKNRIKKRVADGGHGVSEQDIERRYQQSLERFFEILPQVDYAEIYDNTDEFVKIAQYESGTCIWQAKNPPQWFTSRKHK